MQRVTDSARVTEEQSMPISRIATCFNLPACRVYEILRQTVGLLKRDLFI
jgi:hypothetical protein